MCWNQSTHYVKTIINLQTFWLWDTNLNFETHCSTRHFIQNFIALHFYHCCHPKTCFLHELSASANRRVGMESIIFSSSFTWTGREPIWDAKFYFGNVYSIVLSRFSHFYMYCCFPKTCFYSALSQTGCLWQKMGDGGWGLGVNSYGTFSSLTAYVQTCQTLFLNPANFLVD